MERGACITANLLRRCAQRSGQKYTELRFERITELPGYLDPNGRYMAEGEASIPDARTRVNTGDFEFSTEIYPKFYPVKLSRQHVMSTYRVTHVIDY